MIGNRVEELLLLSPRELVARLLVAEAEVERLKVCRTGEINGLDEYVFDDGLKGSVKRAYP